MYYDTCFGPNLLINSWFGVLTENTYITKLTTGENKQEIVIYVFIWYTFKHYKMILTGNTAHYKMEHQIEVY